MAGHLPAVLSLFNIHSTRIGGTETFARELTAQLGAAGWHSVLATLSAPPEPVARFLDLPNVRMETCACSRVTARSLRELAGILRRHRPRILHLHFLGLVTPYPWLAKAYGVERVFITDHHSWPEGSTPARGASWRRALRRLSNLPVTGIVSVSDSNRSFQTALGAVPPGRIVRVYNGVDLTRTHGSAGAAEFRRRYGIPADRRLVVQVSMIIPEKGVGDLLGAAALVVAEEPAAHFVFVGEGVERAAYTRAAMQAGIGDHVTFTGAIVDPVADGVFAGADVICQVSRWQEAFGWTIIEGMSIGKPVVGTRVGGIPELIEDGVTGFLAKRGDVRHIASLILSLLRDAAARDRMGRAARSAVERKFELRANVADVLTLYGISS
jgi:glycosyltransferase involved in cell wall biosynthesis